MGKPRPRTKGLARRDHDGICRAGEFVWRQTGSFHQTHSDEGAVILAIYRKPNVFQHGAGYARKAVR